MSPANAYYYNNEGRVDNALGAFDGQYLPQAEQAYQEAVHWDPSSPFFIVNWATSLEKLGKEKEARDELEKAFQFDPAFTAKILAQMAFEKYRSGDKQKAFQFLDEAIRGNTSSAEAYYCRGILYLSEKNKKLALADFETVKSLQPTPEKNPSIQSLDQFIEQARN
jgi:tetratricopeptide (TPR) repeat protein